MSLAKSFQRLIGFVFTSPRRSAWTPAPSGESIRTNQTSKADFTVLNWVGVSRARRWQHVESEVEGAKKSGAKKLRWRPLSYFSWLLLLQNSRSQITFNQSIKNCDCFQQITQEFASVFSCRSDKSLEFRLNCFYETREVVRFEILLQRLVNWIIQMIEHLNGIPHRVLTLLSSCITEIVSVSKCRMQVIFVILLLYCWISLGSSTMNHCSNCQLFVCRTSISSQVSVLRCLLLQIQWPRTRFLSKSAVLRQTVFEPGQVSAQIQPLRRHSHVQRKRY